MSYVTGSDIRPIRVMGAGLAVTINVYDRSWSGGDDEVGMHWKLELSIFIFWNKHRDESHVAARFVACIN